MPMFGQELASKKLRGQVALRFRYQSEKLSQARRTLMAPHRSGAGATAGGATGSTLGVGAGMGLVESSGAS